MIGDARLNTVPDKKYNLVIKPGTITLEKLAVEVLNLINNGGGSGGTGVNMIDLANRMSVDNDTVADAEIQNSLFLYDVYNRVSAIARVVEPQSGTRYALFKVSLYDEVGGSNVIKYITYTTEDAWSESATWHYNGVLDKEDSLYPWAMSVFGDAVIDTENDILVIGNKRYGLEPYTDEPVISWFYNVPEITKFTYPTVDANGGTVYPFIEFSQLIVKTSDYGSRVDSTNYTLTGKIEHLDSQYGITYSDRSLVVNEVSVVFTGNNPYQAGGTDTVGAVNASALDRASVRDIRNVSVTLTLNGKSSAEATATVKQDAAWIDAVKNVNVVSAGGENIVEVNKSVGVWVEDSDVVVASDCDWITRGSVLIEDNKVKIAYTVAANNTLSSRTGNIIISTDIAGLQSVVTVVQAASVAVIEVSSPSIAFEPINVGSTSTYSVTVNGSNINKPITISRGGTNRDMFSVTPSMISESEAASGKTLMVSYSPTAAGIHTGTITLSSIGADSVTINLSGEAQEAATSGIGYYGVSSAASGLPTTFSGASGTFEIVDGKTITVSGTGRYAWIAIPVNSGIGSVTGVDKNGDEIDVLVNNTSIRGYVIYYKSGYSMNFTDDTFTFTLLAEGQGGGDGVTGSFYMGQCNLKPAAFGQLDASELTGYGTLTQMSSGTIAAGTVNGVPVDGYRSFDATISTGNETFFVMLPSNLDIAIAWLHSAIESYSSGTEIKDPDYWEAVHGDVTVNGVVYRVYGYNNEALPGSRMTVYIKNI